MTDLIWDLSEGRYVSGESDVVVRRLNLSVSKPPLIFCHQHQTSTEALLMAEVNNVPYYRNLFAALAEDYTVCAADLGYVGGGTADLWGNPTNINRVAQVRSMLSSQFGSSGPLTLIGTSHGNLPSMNYALANPSQIAAVVGITPALSINDIKQYNGGQYAADINSRYSGGYTDAAYGLQHSPHYYRHLWPASSIPTAFFTASDDTVTRGPFVNDFLEAHLDSAGRSIVRRYDVGEHGHSQEAIAAAVPGVIDWVRGNRNK